jgi:2-polyprenyl-3-methyl-5-hydroxy-6-metoxy-1,4-benzoquinol methylase
MTSPDSIKKFYNAIQFPGLYTHEQLSRYSHCPENAFLAFIHQYLQPGQRVLDSGCGTGLISNVFATRFASDFTAVDFSDSILYGKKYAKKHNINNVHWEQQDLTTYKPKEKFDVVICQGVLHHIPDYKTALQNLKQVVKTGGVLLIGLYHPYGKILKKFFTLKYATKTLELDQEENVFELAFSYNQVLDMCNDLEFLESTPPYNNEFVAKIGSLISSTNGGLILYAFRNTND